MLGLVMAAACPDTSPPALLICPKGAVKPGEDIWVHAFDNRPSAGATVAISLKIEAGQTQWGRLETLNFPESYTKYAGENGIVASLQIRSRFHQQMFKEDSPESIRIHASVVENGWVVPDENRGLPSEVRTLAPPCSFPVLLARPADAGQPDGGASDAQTADRPSTTPDADESTPPMDRPDAAIDLDAAEDVMSDGSTNEVGASRCPASTDAGDVDAGLRSPLFSVPATYAVGAGANDVAVADFNRDGRDDLAVTTHASLWVLLGNGDGTFQPATDHQAGSRPVAVAVADLSGDGSVDLVAANSAGRSVSVLLGRGDGTFQSHVDYVTAAGPSALALGDFDRDGDADIVVANYDGRSVTPLLGAGDGTFVIRTAVRVGVALSIGAADLDQDQSLDLVLGGPSVDVLWGDGTGGFTSPLAYADVVGASVAVGDLNGDDRDDVVATDYSGSIHALLAGTARTAATIVSHPIGRVPESIAIGDLNGDGTQDLALGVGDNEPTVLLGRGDGTFVAGPSLCLVEPSRVARGDFNRDGKLDLAVTSYTAGTVAVLLNTTP
jgi:hypothetical protein